MWARVIKPTLHGPTVRGRLRVDRGLLALAGLVVALASALLAAVWPLTVRTADEAMAYSVRAAGPGASVVATLPQPPFIGERRRDPDALSSLAEDIATTRATIPDRLQSVVRPSRASLTSPALPVSGPGPQRTLRLVYVQAPSEPPAVTWVAGSAPQSSAGPGEDRVALSDEDPPWPVQVGLSEQVALAIDLVPGDRLPAKDRYGQDIDVRISGIYSPDDPDDPAWTVARELLSPTAGTSDGIARTSVAALVSPEALPDLRIAVPSDQLTEQITFQPDPRRLRWEQSSHLRQDVVQLVAAPGLDSGEVGWNSALDRVLDDASAEVASARGRAQVLLVGLLVSAMLTLVLAAQLLARRRADPLSLARERGATLWGVGAELAVESLLVAVAGVAVGSAVTAILVGSVGGGWLLPVIVVAALTAPVLGTIEAGRTTSARRVPANRAARRTAGRRRRVRRVVLEAAVVGLAGVTYVALRQRGPVEGDLAPSSTPTVWALVGALLLVRVLPPLVRLAVRLTGRSVGRVRFFVAARVAAGGLRALPLVVVVVAVAQLVLGTALAATQQRGQESGALLAVGGDARLETPPTPALSDLAAAVGEAPGVDAAVAGRVADGTLASAVSTGASVRLVVVDAGAYERLLAANDLPDAPQLGRLTKPRGEDAPVPALLLGGPPGLEDGLHVRWGADDNVALDVVGEAPRVDATTDPVVVVDAAAFAAAGALADPDTIWVVGPGAADALRAAAEDDPATAGIVQTVDEALTRLRDAPLPTALVHLAVAGSLLLGLLAGLGVVLGAALDAPARATALGRLRSLGLPERDLRRVLAGELLAPVVASVLTGLVVGVATAWAIFGSLGLEEVTGQSETPQLVVPLWTWLAAVALPVAALLVAARQSRRLRHTNLALLLRTGNSR